MSQDELDDGWDDSEPGDASALATSNPRLAELDEGWGEDADEELRAPGSAPAASSSSKKPRARRAPRDVRAQRQREADEKRSESRAKKQAEIDAKRKRKQPKEKRPPRTEPSKRQRRATESARAETGAPRVYGGEGAPDLAREVPHRKAAQGARTADPGTLAKGRVPSWAGYLVLALLLGGAALYLLLQR